MWKTWHKLSLAAVLLAAVLAGPSAEADEPKPESPKPESPKPESPKPESPKPESAEADEPKSAEPKSAEPKSAEPKPSCELIGHTDWVKALAFTPDGRRIVSASFDRTLRIWTLPTTESRTGSAVDSNAESQAKPEPTILEGHADRVLCVAVSPDGKRIASGSFDTTVRVWDAATGRQLCRFDPGDGFIKTVAFSPDGKRLLAGGGDKVVLVLDPDKADAEPTRLVGHQRTVDTLAVSADGATLLTGGHDQVARIWDLSTGREVLVIRAPETLRAMAVSPDGRWVAAGGWDRIVRVWRLPD